MMLKTVVKKHFSELNVGSIRLITDKSVIPLTTLRFF